MFLCINCVDFFFTIKDSKHRFSPEIKSRKIIISDDMEIFRFKTGATVITKQIWGNFSAPLTSIPFKILISNDNLYCIKFKIIPLVYSQSKETVLYTG